MKPITDARLGQNEPRSLRIDFDLADVAVSNYREEEVARLKTILREIYERLGSIEPEIEAAKASAKPKRK
jgi:hypothetical protein